MSEEAKAEGTEGGKKSKKKLIIIIVALLVVLGGAGVFMFSGGEEKQEEPEHVELPPLLKRAMLEPFIVNLAQSGNFLKAILVVEYDANKVSEAEHREAEAHGGGGGHGSGGGGEADDGLPGYFKSREAVIRDSVIRILSSKRAEDVLSVSGKEQLKEELVDGINEALASEEPLIVAVYFSEFIVQ